MSHTSKSKTLSYSEATRTLIDKDVQRDIEDACKAFAGIMLCSMEKFESVSKMVHTLDLQGLTVPLKPRWDAMRRDFSELLWQFRTTAGIISGRLKMFCTTILPMTARKPDGAARSSDELLQVLQSFMTISADHANLIRSLMEHAMRLSAVLAAFHTEFSKFTSIRANMGHKELRDLSTKTHELETSMRELLALNGRLTNPDPTHLVYTVMRLGASSGRRPTRSKLSHQKLVLSGSISQVGAAYDSFDHKRSEVAHALYATQLCFGKGNNLTNTQISLSTLISDQLVHLESGLSLFLGIWARLLADSTDTYQWLRNPSKYRVPSVVSDYMENGNAPYTILATALDICVSGIDPSRFTKT